MRGTKWSVRCVAVLLALVVCSSAAAERKHRKVAVESGGEVLVCTHKRWNKNCQPLSVPTIKITRPPANGTTAIRPGTFVIDDTWHPDADRSCVGESVPGLGVYYRANPTFKGVDTFDYEVTLGIRRLISYEVDAQIDVR